MNLGYMVGNNADFNISKRKILDKENCKGPERVSSYSKNKETRQEFSPSKNQDFKAG